MQASKIKIGSIYAIRRESGELARYRATAVVTRRINNHGNPHDYSSTVEGTIVEDGDNVVVKLQPEALLGPYQEQVELAERDQREKEARKALEEAERARVNKLRDLLYDKLGATKPDFDRGLDQPFRVGSWGEVEIRKDGVQLLLDYLEGRQP
jgi:hypothetical protein